MTPSDAPHLFVVVGEESGDVLAAPLIDALRRRFGEDLKVSGLAGPGLTARGVESLFPIDEIAVMGLNAVLARLPLILRRIRETADAAVAARPDALLIVDSPDFTHRVAKRVRAAAPDIPIIGYVSPSVWAWRPGRAKAMCAYVDHLMALFPFEPAVHERLGGPPCSYVGHRLVERLADLRPARGERTGLGEAGKPTVLVLPGSRAGELSRLADSLAATIERLNASVPCEFVLPAVDALHDRIVERVADWPVKPVVVRGEAAKQAAFRQANAAIAASGTVTLELALAGVPTVVVYKLDWFYRQGRRLNRYLKIAKYDSIVLPNIILGRRVVPEFIDDEVVPDRLASELECLLRETPERRRQIDGFRELDRLMAPPGAPAPSERAAAIVAGFLQGGKRG